MAIRPRDGVLTMETMLFADEVVPPDTLDELRRRVDEEDHASASSRWRTQLIESLSADFDPEKYRDEYRDRVLELIERKAQGEEIVIEQPAEEPQKVPDLMAALEASIAAAKSPGGRKRTSAPRSHRAAPSPPTGERPRTAPPRRRARRLRLGLAAQDRQEVVAAGRAAGPQGGGRGRGPHALALEPRQGALPARPGFTKGQVIDYYTRVAPVLLPHLRGHPLTLKRYPNGVEGQYFYEKQCPSHRPDWVQTRADPAPAQDDRLLPLRRPADARVARQPGRPRAAPVALAGRRHIERPTVMAFDLDPGSPPAMRRVLRGGPDPARGARAARARVVPEDVGVEGHAGLRAAQPRRGHLRRHQAVRPGAGPPPGGRSTRS